MRRLLGKSKGRALFATLWVALVPLLASASALAAADDPIAVFLPEPPPPIPGLPPPPLEPPPNGYLNGPCGLAIDSSGRLYVADHYHDAVDVFAPALGYAYVSQLKDLDPSGRPCSLALDSSGNLYVGDHHRGVAKFGPTPTFVPGPVLVAEHATGVAFDPTSERLYVNERDRISVYDSSGTPIEEGGQPLQIGVGSLNEGYGIAVSAYPGAPPTTPATAGRLYVPDASSETVKIYDPATDKDDPIDEITGAEVPGGFVSLRDSSIAVDRASGKVYVLDNLQPELKEQPEGIVHVFSATNLYEGHLKYKVIHGEPSGLAVDNSATGSQGRVYVTSGNTHRAGIYVYGSLAPTKATPKEPTVPAAPLGGGLLDPETPVGGPATDGTAIPCEGDACQFLPPEPVDPTLTTLLHGLGNPRVRYIRALRDCGLLVRSARRLGRLAKRRRGDDKLAARAKQAKREAKRCRAINQGDKGGARASALGGAKRSDAAPVATAVPGGEAAGSGPAARGALELLSGPGFEVGVFADGGQAATLAGSHPYQADFAFGLAQDQGAADLRRLAIDLPPGLLLNPGALVRCSAAAFETPRSSPLEPSASGESCPGRSQVGVVEIETGTGGGQTASFGLFNLVPPTGVAARLGASPFGASLFLDIRFRQAADGSYALTLDAAEVPQSLEARGLGLSLWGAPWDAFHNEERAQCLNESEPGFGWGKCSVGEPLDSKPLAFLTLPTECGAALAFTATATSWQQGGETTAQALNSEEGGQPALIAGCDELGFDPHAEGLLSTKKASSSAGYVFRLADEDPGLSDPRGRIGSLTRKALVELPEGVTLNPSLGAGLEACTPAQLAAESATNPQGAGCPNGAKIGEFNVRTPLFKGLLEGSLYLAEPDDPTTSDPGAENPFDSLIALYLIAKSADRGILIEAAGKLVPDERTGTLSAIFEGLPQIPYTELEVTVRAGQRAPLVSPPRCGEVLTTIELSPWAAEARTPAGAEVQVSQTDSDITSGIDNGPCPNGLAPFAPGAVAGGVNSNVGTYTPYFVHLIRADTEQEITSYSLVLPKGIVGKLAGIPFCSDAAIAAARQRRGFAETERPSCPAASQVGRTLTGYGVGSALTYAPGRIYLAGPHKGSPLSLVTINAATVGPFDLGTIVVRSAFAVDPRTAQLRIDSRTSDPIPHIIAGIPLHLRDVRVYMDRPEFTRNPTGCGASEMVSTLTGSGASFEERSDDSTASVAKHFQLLNCLTLGFRPRLGLTLQGGARRGDYPGFRAVFRARPGDASLRRIAVTMPRALFLAQNHIRTVCTRVQFAAEACPEGSVYGRAAAHTPLFDEPLRGQVYLRSSENKLPDLVALLHAGEVRIVLEGRIGPSEGGGIRAFFDELPDAPVNRFTMWLRGGRHGLLVNSVNICAQPPSASVKALGQNNRGAIFTTELQGNCKKKAGRRR